MSKGKPLFSVAVIARNESKTLPRFMASLTEFMGRGGEVVVLDTGSSDGTPDVARSLGCRVVEVGDMFRETVTSEEAEAVNSELVAEGDEPAVRAGDTFFNFSAARNHALSLPENDMVFMPDADEVFTRLDIDLVNSYVEAGASQLEYQFVYSHDPHGNPGISFVQCKCFSRKDFDWGRKIIHEVITPLPGSSPKPRVRIGEGGLYLEHWQNGETSREGYLRGLALDVHRDPKDDRNRHYMSREFFYRGRYRSAIKNFEVHVRMNGWPAERAQSYIFMGDSYGSLGDPERQDESYLKAYLAEPNRRIALMRLAEKAHGENSPVKCRTFVEAMLHIPFTGFYSDDRSIYEWRPHHLGAWAAYHLGDMVGARSHWERAIAFSPNEPSVLTNAKFFLPDLKVSVVIPTLGRKEKLLRLLEAVGRNSYWPNLEVIVVHDGEPVLDSYPIEVKAMGNEVRQGAPKTLKAGVDASSGDMVCFLGNDCVPEPGYLVHAMRAMRDSFGEAMDGLVGLNDLHWHGEVATHFLASKRLLPLLDGEFFHVGYSHAYCDNELTERCRKAGKYAWAEKAVVRHDHPFLAPGQEADEVYRLAYDRSKVDGDRRLIEARARLKGFEFPSGGRGAKSGGGYPKVHPSIDMRKALERFGQVEKLKVINFGMGSGQSGLALQLPRLPFAKFHGIDVHEPYLKTAGDGAWDAGETRFWVQDMRDFRDFGGYDVVMAFDVLEHLEKEDSLDILGRIEESGVGALVFIPLEDEFRPNGFGVGAQDHLSLWTEDDFRSRGWDTLLLKGFHRENGIVWDALWAARNPKRG